MITNTLFQQYPALRAALAWTLAALLGLFLAALLYVLTARATVDALDEQIGEVLLERALALEKAGLLAEAERQYSAALDATFAGPQNRAFALKQLGTLLAARDRLPEALQHMRECRDSGHAPLSLYAPFVGVLRVLGEHEEAEAALAHWMQEAERAGNRLDLSRAQYVLGLIALGRGANQEAEEQFRRGNEIIPGGVNALALARLAVAREDYPEALDHLDAVFLTGPTPEMWEEALSLRHRVLQQYVP